MNEKKVYTKEKSSEWVHKTHSVNPGFNTKYSVFKLWSNE